MLVLKSIQVSKRGNRYILMCVGLQSNNFRESTSSLTKLVTSFSWQPAKWTTASLVPTVSFSHDDVIKWKHFLRYCPFVRGIHRWPVNSPHKGQWRGALMFSICAWTNAWVNNRDAGDLRRHRAHYDVTVIPSYIRSTKYPIKCYVVLFVSLVVIS